MPSPNPRVQVCMDPQLYAVVKTLAVGRNMTMSYVVQQLLADALNLPTTQQEFTETVERIGRIDDLPDNRKRPNQRNHFKSYEDIVDGVIDVEVRYTNQPN